jgi:hypothetical protein
MEHHLEQQIAQLFDEMVDRAVLDSVEDFIGFFDEVGLEGLSRLLPVPRATSLTPESSHESEQRIETDASSGSHWGSRTGRIIHKRQQGPPS